MGFTWPYRRIDGRRLLHERRLSPAPSDRIPDRLLEFLEGQGLHCFRSTPRWRHLLSLGRYSRFRTYFDHSLYNFRRDFSFRFVHRASLGLDRAELAFRAFLLWTWSVQLDHSSGARGYRPVSCPPRRQISPSPSRP